MKVKVKDLLANPHRRIKEYEIQADRVQMLMNSIKETFFWDNLIARAAPNNPGKCEIAYGHHRLEALKKLKIEEIDIPIKDIDDGTMLKIMADENAEEYAMSPAVLNETILSVKQWLDAQIKGKEFGALQQSLRSLFPSEHGFETSRGKGVGEDTISKFLGENWSVRNIREALASLRQDEDAFDRKAAEKMKSIEASSTFRKAVTDYKIPKHKQKVLAEKLSEEKASGREVLRRVRREAAKPATSKGDPMMRKLADDLEAIEKQAIALANKMAGFNAYARDLGVTEIGGLAQLANAVAIKDLLTQIRDFSKLFGWDLITGKTLQIGD